MSQPKAAFNLLFTAQTINPRKDNIYILNKQL